MPPISVITRFDEHPARWRAAVTESPHTIPPHHVAIVVDGSFGNRLAALAERLHVWICGSPANRAAAAAIWGARSGTAYDIESGVTVFVCSEVEPPDTVLLGVLDTVDEHHGQHSHDPPWSVIEVFGCPPTPKVLDALAHFGALVEEEGPAGFVARRTVHGEP
jgi:hypothetical protein